MHFGFFVMPIVRKQVIHAARDSQKHITDIKWAPSGLSLAMGAADGKVYVYRCAVSLTPTTVEWIRVSLKNRRMTM